jgi:hypothetical protein
LARPPPKLYAGRTNLGLVHPFWAIAVPLKIGRELVSFDWKQREDCYFPLQDWEAGFLSSHLTLILIFGVPESMLCVAPEEQNVYSFRFFLVYSAPLGAARIARIYGAPLERNRIRDARL